MKTSKISVLFGLCAVLILSALACALADDLPKRQNFDRYNVMVVHSPFAVASAPVAPAATPAAFKDMYVANAARAGDEDLVTLQNSADKGQKEYLSTKGPNEHGYAISNIEWSDRPGQTKVTVTKDGQFATLSFNQALVAALPAGGPGPIQPTMATPIPAYVPPKMPNVAAPATAYPTPPAHTRGVINRNPGGQMRPRAGNGDQSQDQ